MSLQNGFQSNVPFLQTVMYLKLSFLLEVGSISRADCYGRRSKVKLCAKNESHNNKRLRSSCTITSDVNDVVLVFLLLTLNIFHTFF